MATTHASRHHATHDAMWQFDLWTVVALIGVGGLALWLAYLSSVG
jgi:hypothetical protein